MTKASGVYKITIGENLVYIGSAVNLYSRESAHRTKLANQKHYNLYMQRAWNKYGVMSFQVIEYCDAKDCLLLEQKYIDEVFGQEHCMNILPTAGSRYGFKASPESCKKLSDSITGHTYSDETRQKISKTLTGRRLTDEQKLARKQKFDEKVANGWVYPGTGEAISEEQKSKFRATIQAKIDAGWVSPKKGIPMSAEQKKNLSIAHTGKKLSAEHKAKISSALIGVPKRRKSVNP